MPDKNNGTGFSEFFDSGTERNQSTVVPELGKCNNSPEQTRVTDNDGGLNTPERFSSSELNRSSGASGGKTPQSSGTSKLISRFVAGLGAVAAAAILLFSISLPDSDAQIFAGADRINLSLSVSDCGGYRIISRLSDNNGTVLRRDTLFDGTDTPDITQYTANDIVFDNLTPLSVYNLKITAESSSTQTTLLSRRIRTAGTEPTAALSSVTATADGNRQPAITGRLSISDPLARCSSAQLVWIRDGGVASGVIDITPEPSYDGYFTITNCGKGEIALYLYLTSEDDRRLAASTVINTVDTMPRAELELEYNATGVLMTAGLDSCGFRIKENSASVTCGSLSYPLTIDGENRILIPYSLLPDGKSTFTLLAVWYDSKQNPVRLSVERTCVKRDVSTLFALSLVSVTDGGGSMTFDLSFRELAENVITSTSLRLTAGGVTYSSGDTDFSRSVTVTGLTRGVSYDAYAMIYAEGGYARQYLGSFAPDYAATVQPDFNNAQSGLRFTLACDDPFGYYSDFTAYISTDAGNVTIPFDATTGEFRLDAGMFPTDKMFRLIIEAHSTRPSDTAAGRERVTVFSDNVLY